MVSLTPYTANGEVGLRVLLDEQNVDRWIQDNVGALVLDGYVRLVREPYVPTVIVGDQRKERR